MLELKNISKSYQSDNNATPVLKGLNLCFRNAEFVSILGQSGCGKTTLLNIIGGLDHASGGDLIINSVSTKNYSNQDWDTYRNHSIGFVFQSYNLIPHQTVLQNVELALSIGGVSKKERRERATLALQKVGLGEHLKKRPNQLSGGQCQRVSIARALVNNPAIILADEPTGALDSDTSIQVMEILKEISHDRLVIMVTHNPELAEKYSTRIVRMLDGVIQEDTNPLTPAEYTRLNEASLHDKEANTPIDTIETNTPLDGEQHEIPSTPPTEQTSQTHTNTPNKKRKSAMSFWTSMMLSLKNLLTKKRRTFITSLACSIGIIGIAVILSVSTGMHTYINNVQLDSAAVNYVSVSNSRTSLDAIMANTKVDLPEYPENTTGVIPYTPNLLNATPQYLNENYLNYIDENITKDLLIATQYTRETTLNFITKNSETQYTHTSTSSSSGGMFGMSSWTEILDNPDYVSAQYTTLYKEQGGKSFPTEYNEIALVVDKYNRVNTNLLDKLGISYANAEEITYSDIVGKTLHLALNDAFYTATTDQGGATYYKPATTTAELKAAYENPTDTISLKIICVLRQNENANGTWLNAGIAYTPKLTEFVINENKDSAVVTAQKATPETNVLNNQPFSNPTGYDNQLIELGANSIPTSIKFYPSSFENKDKIVEILTAWNTTEIYKVYGNEKDNLDNYVADMYKVEFTDMSELMGSMLSDTVDIITYALIAFSAITLVVSSIMIAIITYASVIERIKEIGVLRSLGARKRDISCVFIAEAVIIGAVSAVIALIATLILNLIINLVLGSLVGISTIATLDLLTASCMILLSVGLNVIASIAPAIMAAKKDPVVALRSE